MKKYNQISLQISTVENFKQFVKKNKGTNSEVLQAMINFFEYNDIDLSNVDHDALSVGKLVNKRFNAIYGMLKIIEKEQTKPTKGMIAEIFSKLDMDNLKEEEIIQTSTKAKYVQRKPINN